tara:strand:+ start:3904 stop:4410 length:507 start_codon:yes stop_codon:yes gene_type:complete
MDNIEWESVKLKVNGMLEGDAEIQAIPEDISSLATMLLEAGDANEASRENLLVSVKGMLKGYPGYPWIRGNQGILPAAAKAVVDSASEQIREAAINFWEATSEYSQPFLRKHGKSKGSPVYTDAHDYANSLVKKVKKNASDLYKAEEWDGSLAGLADVSSYDDVTEEE